MRDISESFPEWAHTSYLRAGADSKAKAPMKLLGTLLMVAGWLVVLCPLALSLGPTWLAAFVTAGVGLEVIGVLLACRKGVR